MGSHNEGREAVKHISGGGSLNCTAFVCKLTPPHDRHENSWRHGRHASGSESRKMRNQYGEDNKCLPNF